MIAYICGYLKTYYPVEYMTSVLTSVIDKKPEIVSRFLNEARRMGIKILPPDVNRSNFYFSNYEGEILYGLLGIKNVGENAVKNIISIREKIGGKFSSFFEFFNLVDKRIVNSRVITNLIRCGCFDCFGHSRVSLIKYCEELFSELKKINNRIRGNSKRKKPIEDISVFYEPLYKIEIPDEPEMSTSEVLEVERELTGFYLSGHPLDMCWDKIVPYITHTAGVLEEETFEKQTVMVGGLVNNVKPITVKKGRTKGKTMAIVEIEDIDGKIRLTVFPEQYLTYKNLLKIGNVILVRGNISYYNDEVGIVASEMKNIDYNNNKELEDDKKEKMFDIVNILTEEKISDKNLNKLRRILSKHRGKHKVYLIRIGQEPCILSVRVNPNSDMLEEIRQIEGIIDVWSD